MSKLVAGQIPVPRPGVLVYATDGSVARRKLAKEWQTGFGYLSSHGHYCAGWCPQPPAISGRDLATVAELRAVWHAVGEAIAAGPCVVLLDSQNAVTFLDRWRRGDLGMPGGYLGAQKRMPRLLVLAHTVHRYGHNLTTRWVPGHRGHLLNEAADSLARMGSRWMLDGGNAGTVGARARRLVEGFTADPRLQEAAA